MRAALVIAAKDLKLRVRDRSFFVFALIAPLALATIISFAFGSSNAGFHSTFAIVNLDDGEISKAFVDGVKKGLHDAVTFKPASSGAEAEALAQKGDVAAAIVVPEGFTEAVQSGKTVGIKVFRNAGAPIGGTVAQSIAEGFADELNAGRLSVAVALQAAQSERHDAKGSPTPINIPSLVQRTIKDRIPVTLAPGKLGSTRITSASYFGPAMAIFFLSFTIQFGLVGILAERQQGTMTRILASPTRPFQFIAGKAFGAFIAGLLSLMVMDIATTWLLGASWGPWYAVLILGSATILAFMGICAIGVTVAKTQEGAGGFVGIVMTLFALLGGNFIQMSQAPKLLQTLSLGTPNGWAIRGFVDLTTGARLDSIVAPVIALLTIAGMSLLIASWRGKKLLPA